MVCIAEVLTEEYFDKGRRACWGLEGEFNEPYMCRLRDYLVEEESKYQIFPEPERVFEALEETTLEEVKVVIIGQDPYPWPGHAHGLAFSIGRGKPYPCASLPKIFDEIERDIGRTMPKDRYCLTPWARQGVLLLNRALTVRKRKPREHLDKGWKYFTDKVVETIDVHLEHVVFMLWGEPAQEVCDLIDPARHKVLCSPHPTVEGFSGSKHFSQANEYLKEHNKRPINWLIVS